MPIWEMRRPSSPTAVAARPPACWHCPTPSPRRTSWPGTLQTAVRDNRERRPLIIGGDCSLLLGVFAWLRTAVGQVGLWIADGHPDYFDARASDTGETADLELALLTGDGPASLVALAGPVPMVAARHVALIGHRTTDLDDAAAAELARVPADLVTIDGRAVVADPHGAGSRAARWAERLAMPDWSRCSTACCRRHLGDGVDRLIR
jgi:arginase